MSKYFVGGDVSKGFADWLILDEGLAMVLKPFRLDDTMAGHRALQEQLRQVLARDAQAEFFLGVEYTGGMEQNWVHGLRQVRDLPLRVARLNPRGVSQYVKGNLTRTITDGVSAEMIARYLHVHHPKISFNTPAHPLEALRPQWTALSMLKKQRQQLSNMLHGLLYTAMPSMLCYCRHGFADWVLSVVAAYPTAAYLSRARVATVAAIPRVSLQRATSLVESAKTDVASRTDQSASELIRTLVGQIRHLDGAIERAERSMCQQAAGLPQVKTLSSFIGIGELSAVGLLMNMPELDKTPEAKNLCSYWGLHPVNRQSGDGQTQPRMSKAGRAQARAVLFMVAMSATVHNPLIRDVYERARRNGKCRMAALGICMHKIARIVYGMLKHNRPFNPAIDQANQKKHQNHNSAKQSAAHITRLTRFQQHDRHAPISRREYKKREALRESQSALGTESEIIAKASRPQYISYQHVLKDRTELSKNT